ncbi:MAG: transposase [Microcoleaceae cyanobacterium MO_207.B10]|nr:transposase [Microcoleaceae cyanobacterium MO_207.B10]
MDSKGFQVFIEHFLIPNLWEGAVVVMDNLPAHKLKIIEPLIQSVGASVLNLSPYSPDFNTIELWWSELKSFLRRFKPTTAKMVDIILATALLLLNTNHFKHYFQHCYYSTS